MIDRRWELLLDDEVFIEATSDKQFRIVFNVLLDLGGYNTYADIAINNLSNSTIAKVKKGSKITLKAGYKNQIETIFTGNIRNTIKEREGASTVFRMICHGYNEKPIVNQSFEKGVPAVEVVKACTAKLGLAVVMNNDDFSSESDYAGGCTLTGDAVKTLDGLAKSHNFDYIIENEKVVVVKKDKTRNTPVTKVSRFTGMEGIPRITEIGCDVTTRLNPRLRIGGLISIESEYKSFAFSNVYFNDIPETAGEGEYKIQRLNYIGDSWGDSWSTSIVGIRSTV
jgi:hypothetical protein